MSCSPRTLPRRAFLSALGGSGAALVVGCGSFPPESGAAFAPWDFPAAGDAPEILAAQAALLAASPHNTQPWALRVGADRIEVFADHRRHLGAMDGLRRELYIGLGCAVENLVIAARAAGRAAAVTWLPAPRDPDLVARVDLTPTAPRPDALFHAIAARRTNRGLYLDGGPPASLLRGLGALAADASVGVTFLTDAASRRRFAEGTIAATEAITADREMSEASHAWYRHSAEEIERFRDGTTLDASGNGATLRTFGKMVGPPTAESEGDYWLAATRERQTTGSAFVILSTRDRRSREEQMRLGRVFQRMALWATAEGLSIQPLNQMPERQDREETEGLAPASGEALAALTGQSRSTVQMAFRVGVAWDEAFHSPRRPLAWVMR